MKTPVVSHYPTPAPVHDFVLLSFPPCGPHLTPLAPGPSSQAYLSLHSSDASQGIYHSCLLFTYTNAKQAATCTCNTRQRVSPHHVVNHSSRLGATIHGSSDAPVLNYINYDTRPRRALWETFVVAPSDGCLATPLRVASTHTLRSQCVSSTSEHFGAL
jgi:hypothetical protein